MTADGHRSDGAPPAADDPRAEAPPAPPPTGWGPGAAARAGRHPLARVAALGLGGLLTLALLAGASYAAANVLVRTSESDRATLEGEVVRAVIDVDGSVEVRPGEPGRARVDRTSTFGLTRPTVSRTLVDGVLTVRASCRNGPGICSSDVRVDVPAGTEVAVTGNQVTVTGLTGPVEATADGGSVELVALSGPIDVRAGGGEVTGEALTSDVVRASVGAGALHLDFAEAPSDVEASAGAGAVVIVVPPDGQTYRVEATSGAGSRDVTVATDPASPRRIRASTGAGSLEVRNGPR